ncbi:hypothetical protein GGR52DRAFT_286651 [Hypoxylon sp. FL1284]|nr:hypothetical protein GGR52DRAFT_286651 [Hypoxylon sp. FL1284]
MLLPHRIPVPLRPSTRDACHSCYKLLPRNGGGPSNTVFIVIGVLVAIFVLAFILWSFTRSRSKGNAKRGKYQQTPDAESLDTTSGRSRRTRGGALASNTSVPETNRNSTTSQVDRNTSVRSIMTLPAYRTKANENEQVIGREGERDGVDVVVEYPTAEDLENMRDEEMEALFQIRLARRRERADRDERQRLASQARSRGDTVALSEIAAQRRAAHTDTTVDELRDAYGQIKEKRQRAVSSISYHDLGVAQLNGTRVRANSHGSEGVGLLSDAASISVSMRSPSAQSHRRDRSASSVLSLDSDFPSPAIPSGRSTPRPGSNHTRAGSSPEIIGEADLADAGMPPPDYEDVSLDDARSDDARSGAATPIFNEPPPDYADPTRAREQRLSAHVGDMVSSMTESGDLSTTSAGRNDASTRRTSRGVGGVPQLPSLRIGSLPEIIIEPSTAHPNDSHH